MNLEKKYLKTSFGNIAYLEMGANTKPPVLFVHGIPTSGFLWRQVLAFLKEDFHCTLWINGIECKNMKQIESNPMERGYYEKSTFKQNTMCPQRYHI